MYLMHREGEEISNSRLARLLGVSPAAVTQSLKRMVGLGLLARCGARESVLTEDGRRMAERIISRHYLLERLLVDTLGAAWDVADEEANHLQVSLSSRLEALLAERLGHPETCPHGNPFPGARSEKRLLTAPSVLDSRDGDSVSLLRVTEEGEMVPGLLSFCVSHNIGLGTMMQVAGRCEDRVSVHLEGTEEIIAIPREYAPFLRVQTLAPSSEF